jgi:hypothetical protein
MAAHSLRLHVIDNLSIFAAQTRSFPAKLQRDRTVRSGETLYYRLKLDVRGVLVRQRAGSAPPLIAGRDRVELRIAGAIGT